MQEGGSTWGDSEGQVCTHTTRFSVSGLGRRGAEVLGGVRGQQVRLVMRRRDFPFSVCRTGREVVFEVMA